MRIKSFIIIFFLCLLPASAQLTLDDCNKKARENYPLIRQYELVEKSSTYDIANANKGYLPQLSFYAKATYQSEVTEIPITVPGMNIEGLTKDQYQAVLELNQTIWDGGNIRSQKNISKYTSVLEKQQVEVELFALKDRVNQLFFGILLLNEQLKQNELLNKEFQNNYDRVKALMDNGMATKSDLEAIRVEQLRTNQRRTELSSTLKAYLEMLSLFIGETVSENTQLSKPEIRLPETSIFNNNRPEILFFNAQSSLYESNKKLVNSTTMPRLGLFAQAGYGKPGLNMLKNEFSPYFIGGVRFNWNFGNFYTKDNSFKKLELNIEKSELQKQIFLFNSNIKVSQQMNEIKKMMEILQSDDEIIELRGNIKKSALIRVENGTLSVTDLIREINAEYLAVQDKVLHEIQLLMGIENLKTTLNN